MALSQLNTHKTTQDRWGLFVYVGGFVHAFVTEVGAYEATLALHVRFLDLFCFFQWSTMPTLCSSGKEGWNCRKDVLEFFCLVLHVLLYPHVASIKLSNYVVLRSVNLFGTVNGRWLKMYLLLLTALCQLITHNTTRDWWGLLCLCECATKLSLKIWDLYSRCALVNNCTTCHLGCSQNIVVEH